MATTVAVRGPSSMSAISPKASPAESVVLTSSAMLTEADPSTITKNPTPGSPSLVTAVPSANVRSRN